MAVTGGWHSMDSRHGNFSVHPIVIAVAGICHGSDILSGGRVRGRLVGRLRATVVLVGAFLSGVLVVLIFISGNC